MSQKGSRYERDICRLLSAWWTGGKRDDVFWRTKGSGGRATGRSRYSGKGTAYQHGDIYATDPIGTSLLDFITIEIKRGYGSRSIQDILDRPTPQGSEQQEFEAFLQQTIEAAQAAVSFAWILIVRKNKRRAMVVMPENLVQVLKDHGCFKSKPIPFLTTIVKLRFRYYTGKKNKAQKKIYRAEWQKPCRLSMMDFEQWLECVTPKDIKHLQLRN